ncbi:MAG: family 65 glycosyl hydrolase [Lactobacillus sp.]|nr:family 65 glycosyl hydrolase [Lactobacillus sp.]
MKKGTHYLKAEPWRIVESGFHREQDQVSESIFSIANEYLGIRGFFDEGYSGNSLLGAYVNGIYEYDQKPKPQYRGITDHTNFMLNCDNWLFTRIWADGELLDLARVQVSAFNRTLDMRTGEMSRQFTWTLNNGKNIAVTFSRLLSNSDERFAYQHVSLQADSDCRIDFSSGIDFNTVHGNYQQSFWTQQDVTQRGNALGIVGKTTSTEQYLGAAFRYTLNTKDETFAELDNDSKYIGVRIALNLKKQHPFVFDKEVLHDKSVDGKALSAFQVVSDLVRKPQRSFDFHRENQRTFWTDQWQHYDIEIDGDIDNQQGIRFCIFQLLQTYRGLSEHDNIGAKGLTGEVYNGHCYWETETVVLPFYLFTDIKAAKQLLDYRYRTLPQAKARAKMIDCVGASYPLATLNGEEGNDYWQHANTQLQPSTAVAFALWHYTRVSGEHEFLETKGIEMLVEISRFLRSRGDYGQVSHQFGFYGVMGPDEFQLMVNHDAYTNLMGKFTFEFTIETLKSLQNQDGDHYQALCKRLGVTIAEINEWQHAADHMLISVREDGVIEQQQGFFDLPHVDISKISQDQYPLYDHWSYDRLFRNDMIKQPDVLMYQFMFDSQFSRKEKQVNYDYYNARTVHESSLSPSIHSILAEELDKEEDALDFFGFATRLDLDNYNNNADAGLHMTSISAAWLNIVYGFGGLRSDDNVLAIAPKLPQLWQGYRFKVNYRGGLLDVHVSAGRVELTLTGITQLTLNVYGQRVTLKSGVTQGFVMKGVISHE